MMPAWGEPALSTERRVENRRLVYYRSAATVGFWDNLWKTRRANEAYKWADQGHLGSLELPFTRYLPRAGRILDAGCGIGKTVVALRTRGYDVEGVDWAVETIEAVRALRPELPIRVGDVRKLDVDDDHYAGYISLGVVEHFQEGPDSILREAHRVLAPKGIMLISVPCFNILRRFKGRLGLYQGAPGDLEFYQYAFSSTEFLGIIQRCGFEILDTYGYSADKGVKDEIPALRVLARHKRIGAWVQRVLYWFFERPQWMRQHLGHMLLVVARGVES